MNWDIDIDECRSEVAKVKDEQQNKLQYCLGIDREEMRRMAVSMLQGMQDVTATKERINSEKVFLFIFRMEHLLENWEGKLECRYEHYKWNITEGLDEEEALARAADFLDDNDEIIDCAPQCVFVKSENGEIAGRLFEEVFGDYLPELDEKKGGAA